MKMLILLLAMLSTFLAVSAQARVFTENDINGPSYLYVLSAKPGTMKDDTLTLKGAYRPLYIPPTGRAG